jgi:hypothetical protein
MPRGRSQMDIRSYNNMRRKQSLTRQKNHWDRMIQNTEQRLSWLKGRVSSVEGQLRTLENER